MKAAMAMAPVTSAAWARMVLAPPPPPMGRDATGNGVKVDEVAL